MSDSTITEEQKRGKRIYRRYTFYFIATTAVLFFSWQLISHPLKIHSALWALVWMGLFSLASRIAIRLFAKTISSDDVEILKSHHHIGMTVSDMDTMRKIVETYENNKVSPQKELLRASQLTESGDTLLRAAAYTDNTPQDQLLRPTNGEEK